MCSLIDAFPQSMRSWSRVSLLPNSEALFLPTLGAAAGLEADVKLMWPEMPLEGEQAQKTEPPKRCGIYAGTSNNNGAKKHGVQLWSGAKVPRKMASAETWKYT